MSKDAIRALNDAFRTTFHGGKIVVTDSVAALPAEIRGKALVKVADFDAFTLDNDPHGEHDFGSFQLYGWTFFFKIDCYDKNLEFGADDPSDPEQTIRVLTLMLAEDY